MKLETQYLWRTLFYGKWTTGTTWHADVPGWRRPGHEPLLETAKQVMVREQPCEWDLMYASTSTAVMTRKAKNRAQIRMPACCPEDPGVCPVVMEASALAVTTEGEAWIVTHRGPNGARELYRGAGPVFVEALP